MRKDASVGVDLYGRDISASKALKSVGNSAEKLGHKINDVTNKMIKGMALAATAAAAAAVKIGVDAVKSASNYNETLSKTQVIFGKNADAVLKFAEASATTLGQSKTQTLDALGTFALFAKVAGKTGKDAVSFSERLTTLSADLASFYNTSPEDAVVALGAALRGENEPIRRYNVLINDAAMKQVLLEKKLYSGKGTLTSQQKALAAYMLILKQTKVAQGDFTRTSDGLANQQRILSAQFENAKIKLGTLLLPVVNNYVHILTESLLPKMEAWIEANGPRLQKAFEDAVPKIEAFLGKMVDLGEWIVEHKDGLGTVAKHLAAIVVAIKAAAAVTKTIAAINLLIGAYKALKLMAAGAVVAQAAATGGVSLGPALAAALTAAAAFGVTEFALNGGFEGGKKSANVAGSGGAGNGRFAFGNPGAALAGGGNVTINVQGSVISEGDLVTKVRNAITQANRRQGADVTVTGLGKK